MPALSILRAFRRIVRGARSQEQEHPSLALPVITQKLKSIKPCAVLELGSAYGANIDFYSSFSGKICVEDLPSQMRITDQELTTQTTLIDLESSFQTQTNIQFDLIMCWDILNYLNVQEMQSLVQRLSGVSKPGTLLFCQMAVKKIQPAAPVIHKIKSANQVMNERDTRALIESPRYNKGQLKTMLAPFKRQRSYLMASGYEEYIFEYQEQKAAAEESNTTRRRIHY